MSKPSIEGEFKREETQFREWIRDTPEATFQPASGRYHLYISRACPWAHGTAIVHRLLGLKDVITTDIVDPYRDERGWRFTPEKDDCTADSVNEADYLAEIYRLADPDYDGRISVPVLWDRKTSTIVSNESIEIMRMLATAFGRCGSNEVDLYPAGLRDDIDEVVDRLYDPINNGVYRAGFARSQEAYDTAVDELFDALERWEGALAERRYLLGERLTLADIRLFPTLVRFDAVYHTHFKCNVNRLLDFPNLWGHTLEMFQLPGVAETVNMEHIKEHYYRTHPDINPNRIVARGPRLDFFSSHGRDHLGGGPPAGLVSESR